MKGFFIVFLPVPGITLLAVAFPFIVFPIAIMGAVDIISVQIKPIVIALPVHNSLRTLVEILAVGMSVHCESRGWAYNEWSSIVIGCCAGRG